MDPFEHAHRLRHAELLAEAAAHRMRRECRRRTRRRPGLAMRLYARVWWASRPRVGSWSRALIDV